jgi:hypothetical protein
MSHVLSVLKLAKGEPMHRRHPRSHMLKYSLDVRAAPAAQASNADSPSAALWPTTLFAQYRDETTSVAAGGGCTGGGNGAGRLGRGGSTCGGAAGAADCGKGGAEGGATTRYSWKNWLSGPS